MGDTFRFGDVGGSGQVNIGRGGRNHQDDSQHHHVDNRGGYYVGGDVTAGAPPELLADLDALSALLGGLRLTADERAEAESQLETARAAAEREPERAAAGMRRFTEIVKDAGALTSAGAALVEPLMRIGRWLGPVGAAVLSLL
ncbi:MAG: hypothetical protein ACRDSK_28210 [Actinophytocola sp.]|uniref:hypothetical protein n=1 Tax=Actinophytocola sp. TaxID=1872138 RepID=UPI003D6ADC58